MAVNNTELLYDLSTNSSMRNQSNYSTDPGGIHSNILELTVIVVQMLTLPLSCIALLFNSVIFTATMKAKSTLLKSRIFIMNSIIADMVFAVGLMVPAFVYIFDVFRLRAARGIALVVSNFVGTGTQFAQLFASVLLAFDRMYAVWKPMVYHTMGYNNLTKIAMLGFSWMASAVLLLPPLFPLHNDDTNGTTYSYQNTVRQRLTFYTLITRQYITIGVNCFVFVLYGFIFLTFLLQRRLNRAVEGSTAKMSSLSLTLTYFLIHISSLCFFVPAPLFTIVRGTIPSSVMNESVKTIVNRILVHLYIANAVINAVILGSRVRLIRQNLNLMLKWRKLKTDTTVGETKSTQD